MIAWIRGFLDAEARAAAGDPGDIPLRRLSNAEYDTTIRDLTGIDLRPTREFPADGAGGEGFTNSAESLSDVSPALLTKYFNAAKDIAEHAVLLPDGVRFSAGKTRRDWTDESIARLRAFYAEFTPDGRLHVEPYLRATVRHREALIAGKTTPADVARAEKLNPKYLGVLWQTLSAETPSAALDGLRARWRKASEKDAGALAAEVAAWQAALWKTVPIGSYRYGNTVAQVANDPSASPSQTVRLPVKPTPGQADVTLYLVARDLASDGKGGGVVWSRPRFERPGQPPMLLRDYAAFGPAYEIDFATVFADAAKYLGAAAYAAHDRKVVVEALAKERGLDAAFLKRWIDVVALESISGADTPERLGRNVPAVPLTRLDEVSPKNAAQPAVNGWRRKGAELPLLMTNSSDTVQHVPGRLSPHKVVVHPTPQEFVAVAWESSVAGTVRVAAQVAHAHPACGNGVAWWLEHRRAGKATLLADGRLPVGGKASPSKLLKLEKGDTLILAVDAFNGDHGCDLTEIGLTLTETEKPARTWDLAGDVADAILEGNPHADKHGNKDTWTFVRGPSKPSTQILGPIIPPASALGRWREAAADSARRVEANKLAGQVQSLLVGARPGKDKEPDRILFDNLVSVESALTRGLDLTRLGKPRSGAGMYGLDKAKFDKDANLVVVANTVTEVRLPAALFRDREFVVDGRLDAATGGSCRAVPSADRAARPGRPLGRQESARRLPDRAGLQSAARRVRRLPPLLPLGPLLPRDRPDRRSRDAQDVPPRRRAADPSDPRRRAEGANRPPVGRASVHQRAAVGREQVPAAVHRLRDAGPAEGTARLLREPAPGVQQAGRRFREGQGGRDPRAPRRAARLRGPGLPPAARRRAEGRVARPTSDPPQEGRVSCPGVSGRAGPRPGGAGVPVPRRTRAARQEGRPGR